MDRRTVALGTDANKGIGYAIAAGLGKPGWSVGVGARDTARSNAAVRSLREAGADAFGVSLDVTSDASVAAAVAQIEQRSGRLDVLVNNAGIAGDWPDTPSSLDLDVVRQVLETFVIGMIRVTNALPPLAPPV